MWNKNQSTRETEKKKENKQTRESERKREKDFYATNIIKRMIFNHFQAKSYSGWTWPGVRNEMKFIQRKMSLLCYWWCTYTQTLCAFQNRSIKATFSRNIAHLVIRWPFYSLCIIPTLSTRVSYRTLHLPKTKSFVYVILPLEIITIHNKMCVCVFTSSIKSVILEEYFIGVE